ncbi:MAG: PDZ domain-containing protein, partial [Desulfotomaculaceae bacterium]|nr:PDZ domain-containing protein [Desulfotomaculaceae bacterium]
MFPFLQVFPLIIKTFLQAFTDPAFLLLFLVVLAVIAVQYGRMDKLREEFFGQKTGKKLTDLLAAAGFGLLGGLAGSILSVFTGLTISQELYYLWPVAIILMLINIRFLCFAYAGGILALSNLFFGFPQINAPQILALVAVLHMVESFLILVSGHLGAVPAYIKGDGGKIVGGFTLQKFWPIPVVAMMVVATGVTPEGGVDMPAWWPLIKPGVSGDPHSLVYAMLVVIAGLGYGDIAIARSPAEKSRLSSMYLGIYSLLLLFMAALAGQSKVAALAAALFSPLGHEAVIFLGRRMEFGARPLYVPHENGLRVLDVLPHGPAWQAGLRSGDIITAVNGSRPAGKDDFYLLLNNSAFPLEVDYFSRAGGVYRRVLLKAPGPGKPFGIVLAPEGGEDRDVELMTTGPLGR